MELDLTKFTKELKATATVNFIAKKNTNQIELDFVKTSNKKGISIKSIEFNHLIEWIHEKDIIKITSAKRFNKGESYSVAVTYKGMPSDGLIVSQNKHGQHTAFGDNWPNRAHYWFPCIDHPSDKAYIDWKVRYPSNLALIANGELISEQSISKKTRYNHYKSTTPLPTKVMVIGLANFAVSDACMANDVAVTSWIFEPQKNEGFNDYAIACDVLKWFENKIADYPYSKLANVQSKTRYGGMENASCIFYFENSVTGTGSVEDLIAHEIAHQWFGNSATESDWPHLWLSEGFATYLTDLYILEKYGTEAFRKRIIQERQTAINFYNRYKAPVVDTLAQDPKVLLNPNSYQKGAWFLHMLRNEIGDSMFWDVIRTYYQFHQLSNATTNDFANSIKMVVGEDYSWFINQWLRTSGHPQLLIETKKVGNKALEVKVIQQQKEPFVFKLPFSISYNNETVSQSKLITKKESTFLIELKEEMIDFKVDPRAKLFFEYELKD
ncbi:MAG: M1 family metallopeptidase [Bacteroidia bacterium]